MPEILLIKCTIWFQKLTSLQKKTEIDTGKRIDSFIYMQNGTIKEL